MNADCLSVLKMRNASERALALARSPEISESAARARSQRSKF